MGVKNLWDILESCKKTLPLHHLQNKRLCIDLSCWIVQLHNVCKTHSGLRDKVYLSSLFHRLRALIALNCSLIFVTDGSIPAIKLAAYRRRLGAGSEVTRDETNLDKRSLPRNMGSEFSCMIKEAKDLGLALGIPCLDGIEEGEAQCALLNSESLCDGCFTIDSDIFLFGAKTVYRDIDLGDGGHVVCYEMVDIERKLGFGRNSLITLALLLGSDYSHGVHGFGPETACKIVKSFGDHAVLQRVALEGLAFAKKTKGLKKQGEIRNCNANKENSLVLNNKSTANEQDSQKDDQFVKVIDAYLQPKCHSPDSEAVHRVLAQYPLRRTELQRFCNEYFGWTSEKTDDYILPKVAERDLRRFSNLRSQSSGLGVQIPLHEVPVTCPVSAIIKRRKMQGKECFEVEWREFVGIKSSIVPADLIERACPEMIIEFEERMQEKKNKRKPRSKKAEKTAAMEELDLKLQSLMLDIESENSGASCSAESLRSILRKTVVLEQINIMSPSPLVPEVIDIPSPGWSPEVIDIPSASPLVRACKTLKFQNPVDHRIDTIHLSDSETEMSPEHSRNVGEIKLFSVSTSTTTGIL